MNNKLLIWLIQTGELLPLDKVEKRMRTTLLADKLLERGHSVIWWASAFDHFKKKLLFLEDTDIDLKDTFKIKMLKGIGYKKNICFSRFIDHRIISRKFKKLAPNMPKPDIIITSMPPHDLAYEAVRFAKSNNIPVLVDIRDPWPDIFLNHVPPIFRRVAKIIFYKDFKMVENMMKMANGLIAVSNTFLEWGLNYAGRKKKWLDVVFYLGCSKNLNVNNKPNKPNKIVPLIGSLKCNFVVTFIGTFGSYHNPSILLDCANKLEKYNITFVLAGDGEFFKEIKRKSSTMQNVIVTGWLNQNEINVLLKYSDIGICPTTKRIDLFPNKAFAYLSSGLPIISAFKGDLMEVIEKYQIGFNYQANDVDALVEYIRILYKDNKIYKKKSGNACKVFDEEFDAELIYERYVEHIEKIVRGKGY